MSTPAQPNDGQQPNERVVYVERQPEKKKGGCMKWGLIILGALIVIGILMAIFGGGEDSDSTGGSSDTGTASDETAGGAEGGDNASEEEVLEESETTNFAIGETYTTSNGVDITVSSLRASSDALGSNYTCADVTYTNNGDDQADFQGYWDWKLQNPSGVITDPTANINEDALSTGELAPGGSVSGAVCFDGGESGEYQLVFEPTLSFSRDTATWVGSI